jgi:hypothetical protein
MVDCCVLLLAPMMMMRLGNEPFTSLFFQLWDFGFEKPWLDPPSKSILMPPQNQSSQVMTPLDSGKKLVI